MMMWQRVITQGIRAEMPGKRILSSVAIDWVTFRSRALSFWRFVVWSFCDFRTLYSAAFPRLDIQRLNVQSGQPKLKTTWGDRVVIQVAVDDGFVRTQTAIKRRLPL